jgi:hypothetical protein
MPLVIEGNLVQFQEVCAVEDAMPLLDCLRTQDGVGVDLGGCTYLHTALLQLILLARPSIARAPTDPFLSRWLAPLTTWDRAGDLSSAKPEVQVGER